MTALRLLGILLALFAAYVVGRAIGILTGIGPYPTEVAAMAGVLAVVAGRRRAARARGGRRRLGD